MSQQETREPGAVERALFALKDMRARLEAAESRAREPIAIIGLSCRFPGADSPDAYWRLLDEGVDATSDVPPSRWDAAAWYDPDPEARGRMMTRRGGWIAGVDGFDARLFGIAPREAAGIDPQQRLLLEVAWEALEDAGVAPDRLAGSRTGVWVGVTASDYLQMSLARPETIDAYTVSGTVNNFAAGRLSYVFGLEGPSMAVDAACASSLVAVHLACQSLRQRECDGALAAGVNLVLAPQGTVLLSRTRALSPDGRCKAFDASADGIGRGEGCGVLVLRRLSDALRDSDRILAVLRGSAVRQDGRSSGLTVPNPKAQATVIRTALEAAGIPASDVGYLEAHGTGTPLGDPIELEALGEVFSGRASPLRVGSVKTNIGHLEAAAGVAGLIKVVLSLEHGRIPPHLHFRRPTPAVDWGRLPLEIPVRAWPWEAIRGRRIAGVSAFGLSGTIAHVVVEAAPEPPPRRSGPEGTSHLLVLSAKSERALLDLAARWERSLGDAPPFPDVCHTAAVGRAALGHRLALIARSALDARSQLGAFAAKSGRRPAPEVLPGYRAKIAFVFGGGEPQPGVAHALCLAQPVFRTGFESAATRADSRGSELCRFQVALAGLWASWGVRPDVVLGDQAGELAARCVAGSSVPAVMSSPAGLEDALATLMRSGVDVLLEIGTGSILGEAAALERRYPDLLALPSMRAGDPDELLLALGALFERGVAVDREGFGRPFDRRRVAAPTYTFQHERLWLPRAPEAPRPLPVVAPDPLVGEKLSSPALTCVAFRTTLAPDRPAFVADHRVNGRVIWPAAAYIAQWLAAARAAGRPVPELTAVRFEAPLVLDAVTAVQVLIDPGGEARVVSGDEAHWRTHATARMQMAPAGANGAGPPDSECLETVRERCARSVPVSVHRAALESVGVGLGASFCRIEELWCGAGEALAKLSPAIGEDALLPVHPGVLDSAFQVAGAIEEMPRLSPGHTPVPASIDSVRLAPDAGPRIAWSHVRLLDSAAGRSRFDVRLFDVAGHRVGLLRGLTLADASLDAPAESSPTSWLYALCWRAQPVTPIAPVPAAARGRWLVICDRPGDGEALVAEVGSRGGRATLVVRAGTQPPPDLDGFDVVAWFPAEGGADGAELLGSALELVQAAVRARSSSGSRLALITRGAQSTGGPEPVAIAQALLWGFGRTAMLEHPELLIRLVDLDPGAEPAAQAGRVWSELVHGQDEQVSLRSGERRVARLARRELPPAVCRLERDGSRGFDGLKWVERSRGRPGPGEVEIAVHAAGLNFRDVLVTLGMYPGDAPLLGGECAGVISAVGAGVTHLCPGDAVIALAVGSFASHVIARADLTVPKPAELSFEQGAALPNAFLTAHEALHNQGLLARGERVLVHAAAGGVGLAAVQLVRAAGGEVFATAGSPAKRETLARRGVRQVFDSRSTGFASQIRSLTGGAGVHLVLNSLAGEMIGEGVEALARGGRFLELGLVDPPGAQQLAEKSIAYRVIALDRALREGAWGGEVLARVVADVAAGRLEPLPVTVFEQADVAGAFQHMAAARHVGKIVVRMRAPGADGATLDPRATYLVTGGLGALGLEAADWLVRKGARHLVLAGRSAPSEAARVRVEALRAAGAAVETLAADVSIEADVQRLMHRPDRPVRGIVHAAGVLDDGPLAGQSRDRFAAVLAPKVRGAWNLHRASQHGPLDFFILYGSAAGVLGSPGQAAYAAANAYLEALAHARRAAGLPALAVSWGPWAEAGMAERVSLSGPARVFERIRPAEGLALLDLALARTDAHLAVLPVRPGRWAELGSTPLPAVFSELVAPPEPGRGLKKMLEGVPGRRRLELIHAHVAEEVGRVLGLAPDSLHPAHRLFDLGLDSLMAVELKNRLAASTGLSLDSTVLFDHPTVEALSGHLAGLLPHAEPRPIPSIEELPAEELEALLTRKLDSLERRRSR